MSITSFAATLSLNKKTRIMKLMTKSYDLHKANKQVLSKFISIMANVINNTDLDKVAQTVANGKKDKQSLNRIIV